MPVLAGRHYPTEAAGGWGVSTIGVRVTRQLVLGGAGVGVVGGLFAGVLLGQARLARHTIPRAEAPPPRSDGTYGAEYPGTPVRMAVLGDSTAAGLGVDRPRDTPAALLARGAAERLHRPVLVRNFAVAGADSAGLVPQYELATGWRPEVAVILIGANDVTHRVPVPVAIGHLAEAVRQLRAIDCEVVVGTCPDLGTIRPIQPPLRWLARHWSRQLAAAQTYAVVAAGGAAVSLVDLVAPTFYASPSLMFSADRFHPSADGYAAASAAILPTLVAAAGAPGEQPAILVGDEGVRSLARAAVAAAYQAGTEVTGAKVAPGRFGQLRHRVRQLTERRQDPTELSTVE
jgi:lysophospholipase L1-like esterase